MALWRAWTDFADVKMTDDGVLLFVSGTCFVWLPFSRLTHGTHEQAKTWFREGGLESKRKGR
jgi:hypothetical protein